MNRNRSRWLIALLATGVLAGCGADPNSAPPGVAEHVPGRTAGALAAAKGGACNVIPAAVMRRAFEGTVAAPIPDNLTPGLDRCTWRIAKSSIGPGTLIVFRPLAATSPRATPGTTRPHSAPAFNPATLTLHLAGAPAFSAQFVPDPSSHPHPAAVDLVLRALWQSAQATPAPTG